MLLHAVFFRHTPLVTFSTSACKLWTAYKLQSSTDTVNSRQILAPHVDYVQRFNSEFYHSVLRDVVLRVALSFLICLLVQCCALAYVGQVFNQIFFRFRVKYHPDESGKRKEEQKKNLLRRLEIFEEMQAQGIIDKLHVDFDCAADIIRVMDTR